MNQFAPITPPTNLPATVASGGRARLDALPRFFAANIRSPHTRRAYARAAEELLAW